MGRRAGDGGRSPVLRTTEQRVRRRRSAEREGALVDTDERPHEGVANDVRVSWQAICRRGGGAEHHLFGSSVAWNTSPDSVPDPIRVEPLYRLNNLQALSTRVGPECL